MDTLYYTKWYKIQWKWYKIMINEVIGSALWIIQYCRSTLLIWLVIIILHPLDCVQMTLLFKLPVVPLTHLHKQYSGLVCKVVTIILMQSNDVTNKRNAMPCMPSPYNAAATQELTTTQYYNAAGRMDELQVIQGFLPEGNCQAS